MMSGFVFAMSDALGLLLVSVGFFLICIALPIILYIIEKKRTKAFAAVARESGYQFSPAGTDEIKGELTEFDLFNTGCACKMIEFSRIMNLLIRSDDGDLILAMDYQYTHIGGYTCNQTVFFFGSPSLDLPVFHLRPEGFFDKIGGFLGFQDIDFDTHPVFSAKYLLKGKDEPRIREAFRPAALDWFDRNPGWCVEAASDRLIVYRRDRRVKPDDIIAAIQDASAIRDLFIKG